ncbi:ssDNA binding protein [Mycobacterium phage EasyJones]|nr:ssDNA binding protein [Mycobacterium phage Blackbrain]QZM07284.1 ssDNA binding protein [Mycobacterium phage EasyJones]
MATGFGAMKRAVTNANTPKSFGARLDYFKMDDGDSIIVRFLTDPEDIITCDVYQYVKDNRGKVASFVCAPSLHAEDPDWKGQDWVQLYGGMTEDYKTKALVPAKAKERTMAIVVEREEVALETPPGERPRFKYQDKLVDVEVDGKTYQGRRFILIQEPAKTFWGQPVGYAGEYGTLCDRDYKITRQGSGLATQYILTPKGEDPDWRMDGSSYKALHERYGYGTGKDMNGQPIKEDDPERFLYCPTTLWEWAVSNASEERARNLLAAPRDDAAARRDLPTATSNNDGPPWSTGPDEAQAGPPTPAPATSGGDISSLRARLESYT